MSEDQRRFQGNLRLRPQNMSFGSPPKGPPGHFQPANSALKRLGTPSQDNRSFVGITRQNGEFSNLNVQIQQRRGLLQHEQTFDQAEFRGRNLPSNYVPGSSLARERPVTSRDRISPLTMGPPRDQRQNVIGESRSLNSSFSRSIRFNQSNNQIDTSQSRFQQRSFSSLRQGNASFSHNKVPGLNLTNFAQRPLDAIQENSLSQRSFDMAPMQNVVKDLIEKKSFDEKRENINDIKKRVETAAQFQSDATRNDLSIQLENNQEIKSSTKVEFDPLAYQVVTCAKLPDRVREILERLQDNRLNREDFTELTPIQRLANIGAVTHLVDNFYALVDGQTLILWQPLMKSFGKFQPNHREPVEYTLADNIQKVCFYESDKLGWEPKLIVVTEKQILLKDFERCDDQDLQKVNVERNRFNLTRLKESSEFVPVDLAKDEEVSWIGHLSKIDRVFYASHLGNYCEVFVKELFVTDSTRKFQMMPRYRNQDRVSAFIEDSYTVIKNKVLDVRSTILANKRLTVARAQDQHSIAVRAARNVIPHWMNFTVVRKVIIAVTADQDRNWLYVLVNKLSSANVETGKTVDLFDRTEIEVYDQGILGDRFKRIAIITQERLTNAIHSATGKGLYLAHMDRKKFDSMAIVAANPISRQFSKDVDVVLSLTDGRRVFVKFHLFNEVPPYNSETERHGLQFDVLETQRPTESWRVVGVHGLPDEKTAKDNFIRGLAPFKCFNAVKGKKIINQNVQFEGVLPTGFDENGEFSTPKICHGNYVSVSSEHDHLIMKFLTKNESAYAQMRTNQVPQMLESFSFLRFPKEQPPREQDLEEPSSEQVIDIATSDFIQSMDPESDIDLQRVLGGVALQKYRGWGFDNIYSVMQIHGLEKQTSSIYLQQAIRVTTTHRQMIIKQMRPIDQLVKILETIQNQAHEELDMSDFEDFCGRYTVVEVCAMLTQIVSQGQDEPYQGSRKLDASLVQMRSQRSKLRRQGHYSKFASRFNNQPRQSGTGNDQSPARGNDGNQSFFLNRSALDDNVLDDRGDIAPFLFGPREESLMAENGYMKRFKRDTDICIIAELLLNVYGDSVQNHQIRDLQKQMTGMRLRDQPEMQEIMTNKYDGIFLYLQRVLRPIWDLKVTRMPRSGIYTEQLSNVAAMLTARKKLENLRTFLEMRQQSLLAVSKREALLQLKQDVRYTMREQNPNIWMPDCTSLEELDPYITENMQELIKKKWESCLIFVQRCLDVINFLRVTSFHNEGDGQAMQSFSYMIKMIASDRRHGHKFLKELTHTNFSELVQHGASQEGLIDTDELRRIEGITRQQIDAHETGNSKNLLLRKMYQYYARAQVEIDRNAAKMRHQDLRLYKSAEREHKRLKNNAERLQDLCPTLFSPKQIATFIGEVIIQNAQNEKDLNKKAELVKEGVGYLVKIPENINLPQAVDDLAKCERPLEIAFVVLRKLRYLREVYEQKLGEPVMTQQLVNINNQEQDNLIQQMFDCYDIMVSMQTALFDQIQENAKQKDNLSMMRVLSRFSGYRIAAMTDQQHRGEEGGGDSKWLVYFRDHFSQESFFRIRIEEKKQLFKDMMKLVQEAHDLSLTKQVMTFLINKATPKLNLKILPRIDFESFEDVCRFILEQPWINQQRNFEANEKDQPYIRQVSIELVLRILYERKQFEVDSQAIQIKATLRYCDIVCLICHPDNNLKIMNDENGKKEFITCHDKKRLCQQALDLFAELPQVEKDREQSSHYLQTLSQINNAIKFQIRIIEAIKLKVTQIIKYQKDPRFVNFGYMALPQIQKNQIDEKIKDLMDTKLMKTVNYTEEKLVIDYVFKYSLFDLIYEYLNQEITRVAHRPQYSDANQDLADNIYKINEQFELHLGEIQLFVGLKHENEAMDHKTKLTQFKYYMEIAYDAFSGVAASSRGMNISVHQKKALQLCFESLLNHASQEPMSENLLDDLSRQMKLQLAKKPQSYQAVTGSFFVVSKVIEDIGARKSHIDGKISLLEIEKCIHVRYCETESDYDMCLYLIAALNLVRQSPNEELQRLIGGNNSSLEIKLQNIESRLAGAALTLPRDYSAMVNQVIDSIRAKMQ